MAFGHGDGESGVRRSGGSSGDLRVCTLVLASGAEVSWTYGTSCCDHSRQHFRRALFLLGTSENLVHIQRTKGQ